MSDVVPIANGRNTVTGHFAPGNTLSPGRPKGSRCKLSEDFLSALHRHFLEHGEDAIQRMCEEDPSGYVKAIAGLMPREIMATVDAGQTYLEALRLVAEREANGSGAKVIEHTDIAQ